MQHLLSRPPWVDDIVEKARATVDSQFPIAWSVNFDASCSTWRIDLTCSPVMKAGQDYELIDPSPVVDLRAFYEISDLGGVASFRVDPDGVQLAGRCPVTGFPFEVSFLFEPPDDVCPTAMLNDDGTISALPTNALSAYGQN